MKLVEGMKRSLENTRDTALRNIEYIGTKIGKIESEIVVRQDTIAAYEAEIEANKATLAQAEEMLNADA